MSWYERTRAAVLAYQGEKWFSAGNLPYVIYDHEVPGARELYKESERIKREERRFDFTAYFNGYREWAGTEQGLSDGNMRRICERLWQEGVLERRREVCGYHTYHYYRPARQALVQKEEQG